MTNNKGSAAWMAPEVFEGERQARLSLLIMELQPGAAQISIDYWVKICLCGLPEYSSFLTQSKHMQLSRCESEYSHFQT